MMSTPLILGSDLEKLSPEAVKFLGNREVIAIDQDPLGRMGRLVRRNHAVDALIKLLKGGDYAIAISNRSAAPVQSELHPVDVGFKQSADCHLDAKNLWSGAPKSQPPRFTLTFHLTTRVFGAYAQRRPAERHREPVQ